MGLFTGGSLSVTVRRLTGPGCSLDRVAKAMNSRPYPVKPSQLSSGWGSMADDPIYAEKSAVRAQFGGSTPAQTTNHNGTPCLRARFYYDYIDLKLRGRLAGEGVPWTAYSERAAFDCIFLDEGEPEELTVLVSTRKSDEVPRNVEKALLDIATAGADPLAIERPTVLQEYSSDFFVWLLYKSDHGNVIGDDVTIAEMNAVKTDRSGKRSAYSNGATLDREELLAQVARNQAQFGPAKVGANHKTEPRGYFEFELFHDGGFSVIRKNSIYRDPLLLELKASEAGQRMVEDVWQEILPKVRRYYRSDSDWRSIDRDQFIVECKDALRKIADS